MEKCLRWGGKCPVRAVRQESYSFKSLRPRRRIFTECLLSVIKRSQLYFYCPNLVKQFSGVKTKEQQCRMGVGSVLGPDASEPVAVLWGGGGGDGEEGLQALF